MSRMDRVAALFHAARELSGEARETFLEDAARAEEEAVVARARSLLAAHDALEASPEPDPGREPRLAAERAADLLRWAAVARDGGWEELDAGDRVGRYAVVRPLGRGGMGAVYLAHDPVLDRHVALKLLPPVLADPDRLLEEARAASALDHPCIGAVYDVGRDDRGRPYLAMASYAGGTLRDRLAGGALPVEEAIRIAVQVADALHAAHERGIVHRDIKPENLVFDDAGRVKVVDFGIAHAAGRGASPGGTGGTLAYMSPEQARGDRVDGRSDLWSLAVVLHEMLTGERPLVEPDPRATAAGMAEAGTPSVATRLEGVPAPLAAVVARTLAPDPGDRFPTGRAFASALREATTPPRSEVWSARRATRRWIGATLVGAAGLVFLAGVLAARGLPRVVEATGWAGPAFGERGLVVVADLVAADDLEELALAMREALIVDLQQSGYVTVAGRSRIADILERMGHGPDARVGGPLALEVAERAGAGAVVEATAARAGGRYVLSARALRPATGEELFSVRTSAGERRLLGAVERLSREIRLRLGESREGLAASLPLPAVTTPSLDALRMYAEAERWLSRDGERAAAFLRAALELDPEFAMAHRLAGSVAVNSLRFSDAATHLGHAWEHRHRLPDRERWHVEAMHASEVAFEPWRAAELYERILVRFPDDARAAANLGATRMSWLADPEGAHVAWMRAVDVDGQVGPALVNAVYSAFLLTGPERADALAERAEAAGLDGFLVRWRVARAFGVGDREGRSAACEAVLAADLRPSLAADDREVCGSMAVADGDLARGIALLEEALAGYVRDGRHRNVAHASQALATADLLRGDTASARGRLLAALADLPAEGFVEPDRFITRQNLRIQAALHGWRDIEGRAARQYPPYPDPGHWFGQAGERLVAAATAVHAGDGHAALQALEGAFPPGVMAMGWRTFDELLRGHAFEALGEPALAAEHYARAADRAQALFPVLTKDRMNIPLAEAGLARVATARFD